MFEKMYDIVSFVVVKMSVKATEIKEVQEKHWGVEGEGISLVHGC